MYPKSASASGVPVETRPDSMQDNLVFVINQQSDCLEEQGQALIIHHLIGRMQVRCVMLLH
jgi:hypothetical protein